MNSERDETLALIREAPEGLKIVTVELAKAEYLLTADLPQISYLDPAIHEHVRALAAGLVALARRRLEAQGVVTPTEQ